MQGKANNEKLRPNGLAIGGLIGEGFAPAIREQHPANAEKDARGSAGEGDPASQAQAEGSEMEDEDLILALENHGPTSALETKEGNSWYAAHSIAGRTSDGRDKQNQDAFVVAHRLGGDAEVSLFGVFDGHGRNGHLVSYFAKSVLPGILSRDVAEIRAAAFEELEALEAETSPSSKGQVSTGRVAEILSEACLLLQQMLEEQDKFDCQSSGSTAVFSLIACGILYTANVGDSRALLARAAEGGSSKASDLDREKLVVMAMSTDQVPQVREERERIESAGGVVRRDEDALTGEQGPFRVWRRDLAGPGLAMSRSIGDVAAHQIGVSALPGVMRYRLTEHDRLLILATDGVWDMLDNSEVVDISARASGDCTGDPGYAAGHVCQTARRAWEFKETRVDDITCLLIFPLSSSRHPTKAVPSPISNAVSVHTSPMAEAHMQGAAEHAHAHAHARAPNSMTASHQISPLQAQIHGYTLVQPNNGLHQPDHFLSPGLEQSPPHEQSHSAHRPFPSPSSTSTYIPQPSPLHEHHRQVAVGIPAGAASTHREQCCMRA